jgi:hypothetical protein
MNKTAAETVANRVVQRINNHYELDRDFVEDVRQYIIEEINRPSPDSEFLKPFLVTTPKEKTLSVSHEKKFSVKEKRFKQQPSPKPIVVEKQAPRSAYNKYVQANMKSVMDVPKEDRMKQLGATWRKMSLEERAKY